MKSVPYVKTLCGAVILSGLLATSAMAATVDVKMVNKGSDGSMFAFDPMFVHIKPGDSVHFISTDNGHNVETVPGLIPQGAQPFTGGMSQDLTVKFDKQGVYAIECKPHYMMGMVGLIEVGSPTNEDAIKTGISSAPNLARMKFTKLLAEVK